MWNDQNIFFWQHRAGSMPTVQLQNHERHKDYLKETNCFYLWSSAQHIGFICSNRVPNVSLLSVSGSYSTYSAADSVKGEVWYENQSCLSLSGFSCIVESSFGLGNCILMEEDYSGHGLKKNCRLVLLCSDWWYDDPGTSLILGWIFTSVTSSLSQGTIHLCKQPISSVYETIAHVASRLLYWKSVSVELSLHLLLRGTLRYKARTLCTVWPWFQCWCINCRRWDLVREISDVC